MRVSAPPATLSVPSVVPCQTKRKPLARLLQWCQKSAQLLWCELYDMRDINPKKKFQGEEPLDTGGGRFFFSLDASSGLLATRRRLGRRGDSSAQRSAFVL